MNGIRSSRMVAFILVFVFFYTMPMLVPAQSRDVDFLSWQDVKAFGLKSPLYNYTLVANEFFALGEGTTIWSWRVGDKQIVRRMEFTPIPVRDEHIRFDQLSKKDQSIILEYPGNLFANGQELWSFNTHSFKIGKVNSDAVNWEIQLDRANTNEKNVFLPNLFVSGNYIFARLNDIYKVDSDIQVWELSTGQGKQLSTPGVSYAVPYKSGMALLICDAYTENPGFQVLDLATGQAENLSLKMPFECGNNMWDPAPESMESKPRLPFQGFVYDELSDSILFVAYGKLWASRAGMDFQAVAELPEQSVAFLNHGWILPDGRYAASINAGICIREWR